jgi:hypothetical protein
VFLRWGKPHYLGIPRCAKGFCGLVPVGSSLWWPRLLAGSDPPLPSSHEEITDEVAYV